MALGCILDWQGAYAHLVPNVAIEQESPSSIAVIACLYDKENDYDK